MKRNGLPILENQHREWRQSCRTRWDELHENEKIDMLEAICSIIVEAEKKGTTHRGLLAELDVYPGGMFITDLMDIHNALVDKYQK